MTALAVNKGLRERAVKYLEFTLTSGKVGFQGAAAFLDTTTGKVIPAALSSSCIFIGHFAAKCDATSGDTTCTVNLLKEVVLTYFVNGTASDAIAATDVLKEAWALDDQTASILPVGKSRLGRIWDVSATKGIGIEKVDSDLELAPPIATWVYTANDFAPATVVPGAVYDVATTGAASTITLPAAAPDGTIVYFAADGTKNGHTVTYRDATGPTAISAATTASKRHLAICVKNAGKWTCNVVVGP